MSTSVPDNCDPAIWFRTALLPGGWSEHVRLTFAQGRVSSIETAVPARDGDDRHEVGVPGLSNLHSHAFQRGMAGHAEVRTGTDAGFWTWREAMFRFALELSPDQVEAIAAQAYIEMLESGFTSVGEFHYLHHDRDGTPFGDVGEMMTRVAAAADQARIGLTLLPAFYAHAGFGGTAPLPTQRRFVSSIDLFGELVEAARRVTASLDGATTGVAPHSLRAVTPDELLDVVALANGGPVHIHAAEQRREVEESLAWSGRAPVDWLLDHCPIDERWCLVHATHMTSDETRRLAASGAVVGLCPVTEAHLGDGIFPGEAFQVHAGRWGIGTDANVLIDAAGELRALEYGQRLQQRARIVMGSRDGRSVGRSLFDAAAAGGAQALGRPVATITVGAPADVVSLDTRHSALYRSAGDAMLDAWIFAARGGAVDAVWRWGRKVVAGGRHVARDLVASRYAAALAGLTA